MISPRHLIRYMRDVSDITDAVGTATLRDRDVVPITTSIQDWLAQLMPRRVIVVTSAGGTTPPGHMHDITVGRQDVRCYGQTVGDAWALHDAVYEALRYGGRKGMDGYAVTGCHPTSGGIQMWEGDWPYVWTEYTLIVSEGR